MPYLSEEELQCMKSATYNANTALQRVTREIENLTAITEQLTMTTQNLNARLMGVERKTESMI